MSHLILDLGDGREINLPGEMSDESARQLKRLLLAGEERAQAAEAEVRLLRDEMAAMRLAFASASQEQKSQAETVAAIGELCTMLLGALQRVEQAVMADRVMVPDEYGEYTKSKAVRGG